MKVTFKTNEKVHLKIAPVDDDGKAREVKDINWTVLSGDATLSVDEDKKGAWVIPSDKAGEGVVEVSANADLTGGSKPLAEQAELTTTAPQATSLGLTADEPVTK